MKLTKDEYSVLYWVARCGRTDFFKLNEFISKDEAQPIIIKLEKLGMVRINYKEGKVYGFRETNEGEAELSDYSYIDWFEKLGG